jgi:hypothetical protein
VRVLSQSVPGGPPILEAEGETTVVISGEAPGGPIDIGEIPLKNAHGQVQK